MNVGHEKKPFFIALHKDIFPLFLPHSAYSSSFFNYCLVSPSQRRMSFSSGLLIKQELERKKKERKGSYALMTKKERRAKLEKRTTTVLIIRFGCKALMISEGKSISYTHLWGKYWGTEKRKHFVSISFAAGILDTVEWRNAPKRS